MINWLTDDIGTGGFIPVSTHKGDFEIVDVRNLVDKDGNTKEAILEKVEEGINILTKNRKIVICCDYGMSRSNSIAAAIVSKYYQMPFSKAVNLIKNKVPEEGIKVEVLNAVYKAIEDNAYDGLGNSMRLLITGGSGFIGNLVTKELQGLFFVKSIGSKELDLIHNPILLDVIAKEYKITTIIHLANPRIYTASIATGDSIVMLRNVLDICKINKIKLIYVSSWEVYSGYQCNELLADENLPLMPKGPYGESKWLSEELIRHYSRTYNLQYVMLRSSPVYGLGSDKPKFIYNFLDRAKKNEPIYTHKYLNGHPKLDLLYIDDFISAIIKVLDLKDNIELNIGSGKLLSTKVIAEIIVSQMKSNSSIEFTQIASHYANVRMNYSKAQKMLDWQPSTQFESFIQKIIYE